MSLYCLFPSTFFGEIRFGPLARSLEDLSAGVGRVRVTALIGDSQAAMLGEGCLSVGDAKLTLGTGAFLNVNIGSKAIPPNTGTSLTISNHLSARKLVEHFSQQLACMLLKCALRTFKWPAKPSAMRRPVRK